jgi:hypothetical protein
MRGIYNQSLRLNSALNKKMKTLVDCGKDWDDVYLEAYFIWKMK